MGTVGGYSCPRMLLHRVRETDGLLNDPKNRSSRGSEKVV